MKVRIFIPVILFLSCNQDNNGLFRSLKGKTNVEICLKDYKLDSVPTEINSLKNARRLYIVSDTLINGWTSYPPLSALAGEHLKPPFRKLPSEITELLNLRTLILSNLDLVTLPDNIGKLENLDTLILNMNKLTMVNEVNKLKKLKNLKFLSIIGNRTEQSDLDELKKSLPDLTIISG